MNDFPPTGSELAAEARRKNLAELENNERYHRYQLAEQNRKAGFTAPATGAKLIVQCARGIKGRGRAGLRFTEARSDVMILDESDAQIAVRQRAGETVVSMHGAEEILADMSLVTFRGAAPDDLTIQKARDEMVELQAENERLRNELAARRKPKDDAKVDGSPERLGKPKDDAKV